MDDIAKSAGWDMFDLRDEYKRMRVPNEHWVLCTANKDYDVCFYFSNICLKNLLVIYLLYLQILAL